MRKVIITGDDFGLAVPVNEAIIESHRHGALTAASLMVGGEASQDAVERARQFPTLRVGLHLVLVEGRPVLEPRSIPDLVDEHGEFHTNLVRAGIRFFFRPGIRRQLQSEIRAQFEAFRNTGLSLDHVNAHNHMHLHPTVMRLILTVGRDYGLKAVRLPNEPPLRAWRASRKALASRMAAWGFLSLWMELMKVSLQKRGVSYNDFIFGIADSGGMTIDLVLRLLKQLPDGVTEIYFHPATRRCPQIDRTMPGYHHEDEFRTLTDRALLDALKEARAERIAFSDLIALR